MPSLSRQNKFSLHNIAYDKTKDKLLFLLIRKQPCTKLRMILHIRHVVLKNVAPNCPLTLKDIGRYSYFLFLDIQIDYALSSRQNNESTLNMSFLRLLDEDLNLNQSSSKRLNR